MTAEGQSRSRDRDRDSGPAAYLIQNQPDESRLLAIRVNPGGACRDDHDKQTNQDEPEGLHPASV
jgi:hypothetical protein